MSFVFEFKFTKCDKEDIKLFVVKTFKDPVESARFVKELETFIIIKIAWLVKLEFQELLLEPLKFSRFWRIPPTELKSLSVRLEELLEVSWMTLEIIY